MSEASADKDKVLLEHQFRDSSARLTATGLFIRHKRTNKETFIANSEIFACELVKKQTGSNLCRHGTELVAELLIHAYVVRANSGKVAREKVEVGLKFEGADAMSEAKMWEHLIVSANQQESRHVIVFINPNSGAGGAEQIFLDTIEPMFRLAGIKYDVKVTQRSMHAHDYVRDCGDTVYKYTAMIVCGGDGLLYEVLNGLAAREDWEHVLSQLVFGVVPCGSGNGLVATIHNAQKDPLLSAGMSIIRNNTSEMDLVKVETPSKTIYSFLSITWGFMADVDIRSEAIKSYVGNARFTIWAIKNIVFLQRYQAVLSYLPLDSHDAVPQLSSELSDEWITVEDNFITISAAFQSHLSPDLYFAPESKLNDGKIWLILVRGSTSRWKLFNFLLKMSGGTHIPDDKDPDISMIQCKAYRVVPICKEGCVAVDGEEIEFTPFQAQIVPSIARVFVPCDGFEEMNEGK